MELTPESLNQIGEFVKNNLGTWLREVGPPELRSTEGLRREFDIRERIVRVEEELKTQRELIREGFAAMASRFEEQNAYMNARFEAVDKRFEAIDKRFEAVDKRFEEQTAFMNIRFEAIDKRFEIVDKRFEEQFKMNDQRFTDLSRHMNRWMTVISILIGLLALSPLFEKLL